MKGLPIIAPFVVRLGNKNGAGWAGGGPRLTRRMAELVSQRFPASPLRSTQLSAHQGQTWSITDG